MSTREYESVVVKEFGPELAGERVGWVACNAYPDSDLTQLHIATATVSNDGGLFSYERMSGDGTVSVGTSSDSVKGLLASSSVELIIDKKYPKIFQHSIHINSERYDQYNSGNVLHCSSAGEKGKGVEAAQYDDSNWARSAHGLLERVKAGLDNNGLMDYFPQVYYALNLSFMHEAYKPNHPHVNMRDLAIHDRSMERSTYSEHDNAKKVKNLLHKIVHADEKMLKRLTVFSDIPASEVPEAFDQLRLNVQYNEGMARNIADSMLTPIGIYYPDRSYPMMNPLEPATMERIALDRKNVDPARNALEGEIKRTTKRVDYASHGAMVLYALHNAELAR